MASTADFRNGLVILFKNEPYLIADFQHVKPGKGGAFVRTKLKNVATGRVVENTFRAGEKVDIVRLEEKQMQFLYPEGDYLVFMDNETFEQVHLESSLAGENLKFLKEGEVVKIRFHGEKAMQLELPFFTEYKIVKTEPVAKGDTVAGSGKPATLETGAVIQVPFFVNEGEIIRVDTRTGTYMERVKK